jgi:hypothetical protein
MADIVTQLNIGGYITGLTSVFPVSSAAATINGAAIDRQAHNMPLSATVHTVVGAVSGAPTATSVVSTLQHSPDNSTWTPYQPDGVNNAVAPALTAGSTENEIDVDLSLAFRYVRVSTVVGFTAGTSPTAPVAAFVVIGGEAYQPAI